MIEWETTITMRCDKCDGVLIDDYGQVVKITDKTFDAYDRQYDAIYEIAKEQGWSCTITKGSLCPKCAEKEGVK